MVEKRQTLLDGKRFLYSRWSAERSLQGSCGQLGYGSLTFHDTRHAHATILLKAGVGMKVVSQRLGHANISITLDLYAHVLEGMDSAAAEAFDDELA